MLYNYMIPSISSLPAGYDCTLPAPVERLGNYIAGGTASVTHRCTVYHEGEAIETKTVHYRFRDRRIDEPQVIPFVWRDRPDDWQGGFVESSFTIDDGEPLFATNQVVPFYTIYNKPGKKSFFSDNAYRYASPQVITQIAAFGKYVDTYSVVHIDQERDFGESIIFINPYNKPIKARIMTADDRHIRGIRVPPLSTRVVRLIELLTPNESRWTGQIQITATNRVITFDVKHSLADPRIINDHEHLDPFRGESTHVPAFRWLRLQFGEWRKFHRPRA